MAFLAHVILGGGKDKKARKEINILKKQIKKLQAYFPEYVQYISPQIDTFFTINKYIFRCPDGWIDVGVIGCYLFGTELENGVTWSQAKDYCLLKGGMLAEPRNSLQQSTIKNLAEET